MKMNLPSIKNIMPSLRGLNLWMLQQKIKDHTIQRTSTIQLLQRIDIYRLSDLDRAKLIEITDGKEQQAFIKDHGKLDRTTGDMKSHSFTLQFLQMLESLLAKTMGATNSDTVNTRDASNAVRSMTVDNGFWTVYVSSSVCKFAGGLEAAAGDANYGIVVGTGTTTPATADYKIQTLTAHGSGANQLQYGPTSVGAAGVVGSNTDMVVVRALINGSGGTITLKEVGLVTGSGQSNWVFLLAHDAVNQAIANTEVALVSYDLRTTV